MGLIHQKYLLLNSELSDMVHSFGTVILILYITNALLIYDILYRCSCRIHKI